KPSWQREHERLEGQPRLYVLVQILRSLLDRPNRPVDPLHAQSGRARPQELDLVAIDHQLLAPDPDQQQIPPPTQQELQPPRGRAARLAVFLREPLGLLQPLGPPTGVERTKLLDP